MLSETEALIHCCILARSASSWKTLPLQPRHSSSCAANDVVASATVPPAAPDAGTCDWPRDVTSYRMHASRERRVISWSRHTTLDSLCDVSLSLSEVLVSAVRFITTICRLAVCRKLVRYASSNTISIACWLPSSTSLATRWHGSSSSNSSWRARHSTTSTLLSDVISSWLWRHYAAIQQRLQCSRTAGGSTNNR